MDAAKRQAIESCGRCGQSERAHQNAAGTDPADVALFAALGGACPQFTISDAALAYQRHLALAARPPRQRGGRRGQLCRRCANRGHSAENCPL
jgi:hypothetical protein